MVPGRALAVVGATLLTLATLVAVVLLGSLPIRGGWAAKGPVHVPATADATIFFMFDQTFAKMTDWHGFVPASALNAFATVATLASNQALPGSYPAKELSIWDAVANAYNASKRMERFVNLYFSCAGGAFAPLCACDIKNATQTRADCAAGIESYIQATYLAHGVSLAGISFDNEQGDPSKIVYGMETVGARLGLKLAWTGALAHMRDPNPVPSQSTVDWDYSLGQAYTEGNTQPLYAAAGCAAVPNFFEVLVTQLRVLLPGPQPFWQTHMVPMVCGGGNCQETPADYYHPGGSCVDERLLPSALQELLAQPRPSSYALRNLAVWYGRMPAQAIGGDACFCSKTGAGVEQYMWCQLSDVTATHWESNCTACDPALGGSCIPWKLAPPTSPCSSAPRNVKCYPIP